jgi:hypothetical protein
MEIIIDQRIELLAVIQTISGYWDNFAQKYMKKIHFESNYKNKVIKYFEKFKEHETIKLFKQLYRDNLDTSHYFQFVLILGHSELPEMNSVKCDYDKYSLEFNKNGKWKLFLDSIKIFYKDTNFKDFFEKSNNEYEKLLSDFGNKNDIINNTKCIFEYLSISENKNYNVIISPLVMGCYSINIKNDIENKYYQIMCPTDYNNNKYLFNYPEPIMHILWHEIGHTIINDLTEKYINEFDIENIEIPEKIKNIGYSIIEVIINEYIIRSIVYMLTELNEGEYNATLQYEVEENIGFTEVKKLKSYIIENCEKNKKLLKDNNYKKLIDYVINKICKSYCA